MNDINTFKARYPFNSTNSAEKEFYDLLEKLKQIPQSCDYTNLFNFTHQFNGIVDKLDNSKIINHIFRYIEKALNKQESRDKSNPDTPFQQLMPPNLITGLLDEWYPHLRDGGKADF